MKTKHKIIVSEDGKLVLKNIALAFKDSQGKDLYLLEQEKTVKETNKAYEQIENNLLLIGLLKKVDLSEMNDEEVNKLMLMKHEKEERFLSAGRKRGFDLNLDMDPTDILRFYISMTPQERVSFNCKP
jgi:hypothetical protein